MRATTLASEVLELDLDPAFASETIQAVIAAKNNLALTYTVDEPDRALTLAEEAFELSRQQGDHHRKATSLSNGADLLQATGMHADAMARIEQPVAIYSEIRMQAAAYQPDIWALSELSEW